MDEEIDRIIESWGSDDSKEQLVYLLNKDYCQTDSLSELCDGDYDNVDYLEVVKTEENDSEFRASVLLEFDKVTTPGCKDFNKLEKRTAYIDVSISKSHPDVEVSISSVEEPDGDYY